MPWVYHQRSARLYHDGTYVATGYSGKGDGRDNPNMQDVPNIGPTPRGSCTVGAPFAHHHSGNYTMSLTPLPGTMTWGRSGFMIHGDSIGHPGEASNGCIVLKIEYRKQIWESGDHTIKVVW